MTELATQELARARAARIRAGIANYLHTLADISAAYAQRDWTALGYADWQAYIDGEYGADRLKLSPEHRQKAVAELRLAGMSTRAIGSTLGISHTEVGRQLRSGGTNVPPEALQVAGNQPPAIQGADGKTYAAARPQTPAPSPEPEPEASDGVGAADATGPGHDSPQSRAGEAHARPDAQTTFPRSDVEAGAEFRGSAPAGDDSPGPDFGDLLDRLAPDTNPHRDWQREYLRELALLHRVMRHAPEQVAERADEQCIEELIRVADLFADYRLRVVTARITGLPDNVRPLRRSS